MQELGPRHILVNRRRSISSNGLGLRHLALLVSGVLLCCSLHTCVYSEQGVWGKGDSHVHVCTYSERRGGGLCPTNQRGGRGGGYEGSQVQT